MRGLIILSALAVASCRQEPSFDERYETARQSIAQKAEELDSEFQKSDQVEEPPVRSER